MIPGDHRQLGVTNQTCHHDGCQAWKSFICKSAQINQRGFSPKNANDIFFSWDQTANVGFGKSRNNCSQKALQCQRNDPLLFPYYLYGRELRKEKQTTSINEQSPALMSLLLFFSKGVTQGEFSVVWERFGQLVAMHLLSIAAGTDMYCFAGLQDQPTFLPQWHNLIGQIMSHT